MEKTIKKRVKKAKLDDVEKKVFECLQGTTNEEAEIIGNKIIAQILAKRLYVEEKKWEDVGQDHINKLVKAIYDFKNEHTWDLAIGRTFYKRDDK